MHACRQPERLHMPRMYTHGWHSNASAGRLSGTRLCAELLTVAKPSTGTAPIQWWLHGGGRREACVRKTGALMALHTTRARRVDIRNMRMVVRNLLTVNVMFAITIYDPWCKVTAPSFPYIVHTNGSTLQRDMKISIVLPAIRYKETIYLEFIYEITTHFANMKAAEQLD